MECDEVQYKGSKRDMDGRISIDGRARYLLQCGLAHRLVLVYSDHKLWHTLREDGKELVTRIMIIMYFGRPSSVKPLLSFNPPSLLLIGALIRLTRLFIITSSHPVPSPSQCSTFSCWQRRPERSRHPLHQDEPQHLHHV